MRVTPDFGAALDNGRATCERLRRRASKLFTPDDLKLLAVFAWLGVAAAVGAVVRVAREVTGR